MYVVLTLKALNYKLHTHFSCSYTDGTFRMTPARTESKHNYLYLWQSCISHNPHNQEYLLLIKLSGKILSRARIPVQYTTASKARWA